MEAARLDERKRQQLRRNEHVMVARKLQKVVFRFCTRIEGATNDINVIRERAGLDLLNSAELTEDIIHIERIKELSFEGDRLDYLRSAKLSIPGGDRGIAPTSFDDHSFVWKIPQREIDLITSL